jgi:hypothetical protein
MNPFVTAHEHDRHRVPARRRNSRDDDRFRVPSSRPTELDFQRYIFSPCASTCSPGVPVWTLLSRDSALRLVAIRQALRYGGASGKLGELFRMPL